MGRTERRQNHLRAAGLVSPASPFHRGAAGAGSHQQSWPTLGSIGRGHFHSRSTGRRERPDPRPADLCRLKHLRRGLTRCVDEAISIPPRKAERNSSPSGWKRFGGFGRASAAAFEFQQFSKKQSHFAQSVTEDRKLRSAQCAVFGRLLKASVTIPGVSTSGSNRGLFSPGTYKA